MQVRPGKRVQNSQTCMALKFVREGRLVILINERPNNRNQFLPLFLPTVHFLTAGTGQIVVQKEIVLSKTEKKNTEKTFPLWGWYGWKPRLACKAYLKPGESATHREAIFSWQERMTERKIMSLILPLLECFLYFYLNRLWKDILQGFNLVYYL